MAQSSLRVLFDTNIYIAALLRSGLSQELVDKGLAAEFTVICSERILEEMAEKLFHKFSFPKDTIGKTCQVIRERAELVQATEPPPQAVRDPNDNHILGCAAAGKANIIVTLDHDLLELKEWRDISIIHPKTLKWIVLENSN